MSIEELQNKCYEKAQDLILAGLVKGIDVFRLTETLIALELEKKEKDAKSDQLIEYNDEIVEIVEVGEVMTTDISTSGDNLFYCNGILTKNSFGVPMSADLMFALVKNENLDREGKIMAKQLKNRYNDMNSKLRFMVGFEGEHMRLYDLDDPTKGIMPAVSVNVPAQGTKVSPFNASARKRPVPDADGLIVE